MEASMEVTRVEPLLTVKEASELLKVSERTIWRLMDAKELPFVKVGEKARRIRKADLEAYVERKAKESMQD